MKPPATPPRGRETTRREILLGAAGVIAVGLCRGAGPARAAGRPILRAQRLAWAGVRLQVGTVTIWIDPLGDPGVWGKALQGGLVPIQAPAEGSRYALVTHRHPDHFDPTALEAALGRRGTLVCTEATAAAARGIRVRVARLYEPMLLDDVTATAVPAVDGYGDEQVSWVVSGGGRRVFHGGDTLWHGAWWHIGRQLGPFDAAFLPVNGARFRWRKPYSEIPAVLTPEQAVAAAVVMGARLLVPIHYGVVGAEADGYLEVERPLVALAAAARRRKLPLEVVRPGEWLTWRPRS